MKKTKNKLIVLSLVIVLIAVNFLPIGVNLSLAAEEGTKEETKVELEQAVEKYFSVGKTGAILQQVIKTKLNKDEFVKENESLEVLAPEIQGVKPEEVNILLNGKVLDKNIYSYDSNTGKVLVNLNKDIGLENFGNKEETYKLIYKYNEIEVKEEKITLNSKISLKLENEEEISNENKIDVDISNISNNVSIDGVITKEIYKGYMYEGALNETTYNEAYKVEVSDLSNVEKIDITNEKEVFTRYDAIGEEQVKREYGVNNSNYYKKIWLSKDEMLKLLGEDGKIILKDENDVVLTELTKDSQVDENGNIIIEFPNDARTKLKIETTRPLSLGTLGINVEKALKGNTGYSKQDLQSFSYLEETIKANENTKLMQMALLDTNLETKLEIAKETLSTMEENKDVEIKATLVNNKNSNELFTNPSVRIILPVQVQNVTITEVNLLYEDELTILNYSANGREILVNLEGTQTKYNKQAIEGATIVLKANITLDKTATNSNEQVIITTSSNEKTVETSRNIAVFSPKEVITVNNIEELGVATTGDEEETAVDVRGKAKDITINSEIINNNSGKITNVKVLGNMPVDKQVKEEERTIENNLGVNILEGVTTSNTEAKIYYTKNTSATDDVENSTNGWQESPDSLNEMTKYLVVVPEMEKAESLNISYKANIPENTEYNKQAYEDYGVTYTSETTGVENNAEATDVQLNTGRGPVLEATVTATVGTDTLKDGDIVKVGEVIKYKIDVTNTGTEDASNVTVNASIPEGTVFVQPRDNFEYDYVVTGNEVPGEENPIQPNKKYVPDYYEEVEKASQDFTIEKLAMGETKTLEYEVRVKTDTVEGTSILQTSKINYNEASTNEAAPTLGIEKANLRISIKRSSDGRNMLQPGLGVRYNIVVENISDEVQENIIIIPNMDKLAQITTGLIIEERTETITRVDEITEEINIGTINPGEVKVLQLGGIIGDLEEREVTISNSTTVKDSYNNIYRSNIFTDPVYGNILDLTFKSNKENAYIKTDDVITFEANAVNNGISDIILAETLINIPTELTITKVELNGEEQEINGNYITASSPLNAGESLNIKIETIVNDMTAIGDDKEIIATAILQANGTVYEELEISNIIEKQGEGTDVDPDDPNNPDNPNNPNDPNNPGGSDETGYRISGKAWIDANKDGELQDDEQGMAGVRVTLLDVNTNELVTNSNGNIKVETTDSEGGYTLTGLQEGTYIVLFEYDTNAYSLTTYKKAGVADGRNSDVVSKSIDIGSGEKIYGVTDNIEITDGSIANIDIGLMEAATFDLKLDKYITRVVEQNSKGTNVYTYDNEDLARVDIDWKTINGATLVVEYTIRISNVGELQGYVRNIADYIPEGFEFNAELNKDWYEQSGVLYNQSLTNSSIAPGDYTEVTLTLTKPLSENTVGTIYSNSAEILETYNERETDDATPNNNKDNADLILSISTGRAVTYIGLTIAIVAILAVGIILIKKKVLDKN